MSEPINGNMLYEIMLRSDIEEISKLCQTNKEARKIGSSENFWHNKYLNDYSQPPYPVPKWRKEYKMKHIVEHPKKIYKLVYNDEVIVMLKTKSRRTAYKYIAYLCNNNLIDEHYIKRLVRQYDDPDFQVEESMELKVLCQDYYGQQKFKYHGVKSTLEICKRYYLKPLYLYHHLGNDTYSINFYFNLFKYLYSHQFCLDRIHEPYPTQISKPYFTVGEIEMMLNVESESSDGDIVELVEDEYL